MFARNNRFMDFRHIVLPAVLVFSLISGTAVLSQNKNPAFVQVEDVPGRPRVLLIGDSISIGYTLPVRALIGDVVNVHRPPVNCSSTESGLVNIDKWLGDGKWDVIHFNWGLHDLKYVDSENKKVPSEKGRQNVPIETYGENLEKLVLRMKKTGAKLIWTATTPVPEGCDRVKGDSVRYNKVAEDVMKKHGVPTDDLYSFALKRQGRIQRPANVHFTEEGSGELAAQVSITILKALVETEK